MWVSRFGFKELWGGIHLAESYPLSPGESSGK